MSSRFKNYFPEEPTVFRDQAESGRQIPINLLQSFDLENQTNSNYLGCSILKRTIRSFLFEGWGSEPVMSVSRIPSKEAA
jgi:hypothetical protein